jgi:hypothetical protein
VWTHDGAWWSVLSKATGSWLLKLEGTQWTEVLSLSASTSAKADAKVDGDVVHILLFDGTSSELVSAEYVRGTGTYQAWASRPTPSSVALDSGVEIATIDIDSQGRMWLASDASTTINVRYSDSPYSGWSSPITVATGVSTDDICVVTAMPNNTVGVLWSNASTKRFGFKTHTDGANPNTWSADEVPASQSANDGVRGGMADDHMNVAVASDGTLYAAVKTAYDTSGFPVIALLVRQAGGTWDDAYEVTQSLSASRPIVLLNETTGTLTVVYKNGNTSTNNRHIAYRQSPDSPISFGASDTLIDIGLNNPSSTKQNISNEVVILASDNSTAHGVQCTNTATGIAHRNRPLRFVLHQNTPNPFNPTTAIRFEILDAARVNLSVFDPLGRRVTTLIDSWQPRGVKEMIWDGTDGQGAPVSSGVYFYRLRSGQDSSTKKMLLLK